MIYPIILPRTTLFPIYITGIGIKKSPENIDRPYGYHDAQISIITKGEGVFQIGEIKYNLKKGTLFYFNRNIPHKYYSISEDFENKWVCFNGVALDGINSLIDEKGIAIFDCDNIENLSSTFDLIYLTTKNGGEFAHENTSPILYMFITTIIKLKSRLFIGNFDKNSLNNVMYFVENNYFLPITLDEIAQYAGLSKFKLCKMFKEIYGVTVFTYIIKYRIGKAKLLLANNTDMLINDIALSVGFNDFSYFSSIFKNLENLTPSEFRRKFTT